MGTIETNITAVGLGDAWILPADYIWNYAPYTLQVVSLKLFVDRCLVNMIISLKIFNRVIIIDQAGYYMVQGTTNWILSDENIIDENNGDFSKPHIQFYFWYEYLQYSEK